MFYPAHTTIENLLSGVGFKSFYVLAEYEERRTQSGKPYAKGLLAEAGGRIPFVMWDNFGGVSKADVGKIVYITGEAQEYRGAPQIEVCKMRLANDNDAQYYQLSDLVPYAPIDVKNAFNEMLHTLAALKDETYCKLATFMYFDHHRTMSELPAGKSIHHAFVGGWVMHTYYMMRMAEQVYQQYSETMNIDHDLLIAGAFLHDIGKLREYNLTEHRLVKDYSTSGRLLGHPTLGVMMVEALVNTRLKDLDREKVEQVEHIIASHHGSPECGAAVYPQTVEAEIVHQLDSMDSRIEIFREEMEKTPAGEFSNFNRALDRCVYRHGKTA